MAERIHPDDPGFQDFPRRRLLFGFVPYWNRRKNPYRAEFFWRYSWVSSYCADKDVVDVPCGMGWGTSLILEAKNLKGIDLSVEAVLEARQRYGDHATFEIGNMSKLELSDGSQDVICCLEGIEHVPIEIGGVFLSEAHRVLRKNGLLLLSSPYCRTKSHSGNPFHVCEYQPEEITSALSPYFWIEDKVLRDVDAMTVLYLCCRRRP